ncbi:hypothetical protein [Comamonas avium]|uniref:TspB protein n=1 Tax=Comamonas avium TaxID=2762231 RepID=A0ABR8SD06_9BURK|nr:hypothetical protein [Comamonas avium]MBD7961234.1 hypothetical protein [Comamonas avium]
MVTTGDLPYQHKGGAGAKVTISTGIDKVKVAAAAAAATASAAAMQVKPGNPYVQVGALACVVFCVPVAEVLLNWGIDKFYANDDGTLAAVVPDPNSNIETSTGSLYYLRDRPHITGRTIAGLTSATAAACLSWMPDTNSWRYKGCTPGTPFQNYVSINVMAQAKGGDGVWRDNVSPSNYPWAQKPDTCPVGSPVVNGVCNGSAPEIKKPLGDFFKENIVDKPWGADAAVVASVVIASSIYQSGDNVFTDGTSNTITGPDLVPTGTVQTHSPVNVLPGTTTPAPPGHTGPTDSGTQTTTSTTTATNTFNPGTSGTGSGSGSSGSGSGPSMTTGTKTETKTSITNNITNNTSTSVTTNIETKDDAPKEEEKDLCEKNPDSLACAEADTPDGEIPETQIELSYEYESLFGNGSCPTVDAVPFFGQNVQVVDMPKICQQTTDYIQPFVLVSAALIAMAIFAGGIRS